MPRGDIFLFVAALVQSTVSVRINFTNCQAPEWSCVNSVANEIVYSCASVGNDDFTLHLKDYYTDHITSVTVQKCRDLKVVLDCPILQKASQLQRFKVKDCDRLQFISLSTSSLLQTPPDLEIENVNEIVSLPRGLFKSPTTNTELKCLGAPSLKKIKIINSKINTVNTKAIYNVTGMKSIEFYNVTITDVRNQAIEALLGPESIFTITNSKFNNLAIMGIVIQSNLVSVSENTFNDIVTGGINITADYIHITGNKFKQIHANGLVFKSANIEISQNDISNLKTNALNSIRCVNKRTNNKLFNFSRNKMETLEPHSVAFDYGSCKSAGATIIYNHNKMDCKCPNIAFLNNAVTNTELNNMILDVSNNNTCIAAPCTLPVDVVKMLLDSDMCQLTLDPQVICLLYNDRHSNNSEITVDEEITEAPPTFYLIRQANGPNGDASAAMTAVDRDDLLKDSHLNMTNRTAIKVVFDSSKDFVETLRSTSSSHKRPATEPKSPIREDYTSTCVGTQCRNNFAYDRQKALDFYKYVYAQLRPPRLKS